MEFMAAPSPSDTVSIYWCEGQEPFSPGCVVSGDRELSERMKLTIPCNSRFLFFSPDGGIKDNEVEIM